MNTRRKNSSKNIWYSICLPVALGMAVGMLLLLIGAALLSNVHALLDMLVPVGYAICILSCIAVGAVSSAVGNNIYVSLGSGAVFACVLLIASGACGGFAPNVFAGVKLACCVLACLVGAVLQLKLSHSGKRRRAMR